MVMLKITRWLPAASVVLLLSAAGSFLAACWATGDNPDRWFGTGLILAVLAFLAALAAY
jgi:hypothetical protein